MRQQSSKTKTKSFTIERIMLLGVHYYFTLLRTSMLLLTITITITITMTRTKQLLFSITLKREGKNLFAYVLFGVNNQLAKMIKVLLLKFNRKENERLKTIKKNFNK